MPDDFDEAEFEKRFAAWRAANPGFAEMRAMTPEDQRTARNADIAAALKTGIPTAALAATGFMLDQPEMEMPLLARMGVMGGENVLLNKAMPERLGGDPQASTALGFLGGALPEMTVLGGGKLTSKFLEGRMQKGVTGATERLSDKLDADALAARGPIMGLKDKVPFPNRAGGPALGAMAEQAKEPVIGTIEAARQKYGAPIGEAYNAVKDVAEPVDTEGFGQWVDNTRAASIAPSPAAEKYLTQLRSMDPKVQKEAWEQQQAARAATPGSAIAVAGETPQMNKLQQRIQEQLGGSAMEAHAFKPIPTTFDKLREIRQRVNTELRTAKGGDRYQLGHIQDHLDRQLMEHLPPEMGKLRKDYAQFMDKWDYRRENQLFHQTSPQKLANEMFKDPEMAHDLFTEANPLQQDKMRELFIQHVYGDLKPTDTAAKQVAAVRAKLEPYIKDKGTARLVLGPNYAQEISQMSLWPRFTEDFKERLQKDPTFRKGFESGVRSHVLKGQDPDQAAQSIVVALTQGDPELEQVVGQTVPQLPAPAAQGSKLHPMAASGIARHGVIAAAGALTGHTMGIPWQIGMGVASLLSGARSYANVSRLGIVAPLMNAMNGKNGFLVGRAIGRLLTNAASQNIQQSANAPLELN